MKRNTYGIYLYALTVIIVLMMSQCSLILPFYGVKAPRNEPVEMERKYLLKHGIDTSLMYRIKLNYKDSLNVKKFALNMYKLKTGAKASPVQIRMYSNRGKFLYGWEHSCPK